MDEIAEPAAKRRNGCQETGSVSLINYVGVFCSYKYQHELLHRLIGIRVYVEDLIHANINQMTKSWKYYCYRLRKSFDEHDCMYVNSDADGKKGERN